MTNLTISNSNEFFQLAEDLQIDLESPNIYSSTENNVKMSAFHRPKELRTVFDAHKSDGVLKWTSTSFSGIPDDRQAQVETFFLPDPNGGDPRELGNIVDVRGIIMSYQQRDELRYYNGEKTVNLCSVIGYKSKDTEGYTKELPNQPYGMKYTFEKNKETSKWSVNNTKPSDAVVNLGLVGFRGESPTLCADCIRSGLSTETITGIGENGSDKTISCEARARLYMAIFEVSVIKKIKQDNPNGKPTFVDQLITYKVNELFDLANDPIGDFFFLEIPMSKSSIQGKYVKNSTGGKDEEASVEGYESFYRSLLTNHKDPRDPLRVPQFNYIKLRFLKNPGKAPTYQADIRSLGPVQIDDFKHSLNEWKTILPERMVDSIQLETPSSISSTEVFNSSNTPTVKVVPNLSSLDDSFSLPF